ncbi:DUF2971 domain-containing protein [Pseudomonas sp.]|uniref:DUF2971 domain-containing protein n=1 Tax=Pseudomonas sp. TaxID=306 RepID=UPI003FD8485A
MSESETIRIYHFCNEEFGIQNIEKKRLKVATIMDLNDPFEMLCFSSGDKEVRRAIADFKTKTANVFGMLCFSKDFLSPVQWAHYADKHKGLCLAFDVPVDSLRTVEYKTGRMEFDVGKYSDMNKASRSELMEQQFHIKHSQWKYEKEVRQVFLLNSAKKDGALYFKDFSNIGKLSQVIVGCNSTITRSVLRKSLGVLHADVECFKVRTAFKTYRIVRNRNASLWE